MKKMLYSFSCLGILFFLTSCDVHFGTTHYDVPWWYIAIPTAIFSTLICLIAFPVAGKHLAKKKYVCQKCGKTFHPKWYVAMFSIHINDDRLFKCPYCGQKGFCHLSEDQSDH